MTNLGGAIPIPNSLVGARYGVAERVDLASHVNLLPLFAGGFLQWDVSSTFAIYKHAGQDGFNLGGGPGFVLMTDFRHGARIAPTVDLMGGFTLKKWTAWLGSSMAYDFWGKNVYLDPQIGVEYQFRRFAPSVAFAYWHPSLDWEASAIRYVGPGKTGAFGVLLGFKWTLIGDVPAKSKRRRTEKGPRR